MKTIFVHKMSANDLVFLETNAETFKSVLSKMTPALTNDHDIEAVRLCNTNITEILDEKAAFEKAAATPAKADPAPGKVEADAIAAGQPNVTATSETPAASTPTAEEIAAKEIADEKAAKIKALTDKQAEIDQQIAAIRRA